MSLFPQSFSSMIMRPSRGTGVQRSNEPKRIHLNVGGECHSPYVSTLKNLADSPLAMILRDECKAELDYDQVNDVYFFDRHPGIFAHILNYFQTGKLHCPRDVCGPMFEAELHFWGIDETQMEACCWSTYTKHREIQENLKLLQLRTEDGTPCKRNMKLSDRTLADGTRWDKYKALIWEVLDEPYSSSLAKVFSYISLGFIILSIITYSLLSMRSVTGTDCSTTVNVTCKDNHKQITTNTTQDSNQLIISTNHVTLHACASACCSNTTCIGFDFGLNTSVCWMKLTTTTSEEKNVSMDEVKEICVNESIVPCNESYACIENNYFSTSNQSTVENSTLACADWCSSNDTCAGFNYDTITKECWTLKEEEGEMKSFDRDNTRSCFKVSCDSADQCHVNSSASSTTSQKTSKPAQSTSNTITRSCNTKCCGAGITCLTNQIGLVTSPACNITAERLVQINDQYQERISCKKEKTKICKMRLLHHITRGFEILFAVWFTIEIILRITFCPSRTQYLLTASNWFDSMAVIPVYLLYSFPDSKPFTILNMLRYVRVFRLFKLLYDLHILGRTLKASLYQLLLLVFILFFPTLVFSSFVHYSEKTWGNELGRTEFNNMPETLWWSVIIMTTIGYGDKAPTSLPGRLLGGIAAIIGILLVSMTASILGSSFQQYYNVARAQLKIPHNPDSAVQREEQKTLKDYFRHLTSTIETGFNNNNNCSMNAKPPDNTLSPDSKDSGYGHSPLPTPFIDQDHSSSPPVARQRNVIITIDTE